MDDKMTSYAAVQDLHGAQSRLPRWATRRRIMFVIATGVIGGGLALNWGWLTALGLAPVILALAPCAAMCGLGLCMKGGAPDSGAKTGAVTPNASPD